MNPETISIDEVEAEFESILVEYDTEAVFHLVRGGGYEIEWTGAPGATEFFRSNWAFTQRLHER